MAAQRKHLSFAVALAFSGSCKQQPLVVAPATYGHANTAEVDTAKAFQADTQPLDGPTPALLVDNAISDCVEVIASIHANRMKLRFTVVRAIYKCGCPSAAVRYSIVKGGQAVASEVFSAMKYTDRWFEAEHGLHFGGTPKYVVDIGCNVD